MAGIVGRMAMIAAVIAGVGCQPYRIQHVKRPGFFQKASKEQLPDEITLDDGTIVKYETIEAPSKLGLAGKGDARIFLPREEVEDASGQTIVTLRAILPGHVVLNTLNCLRNQEYPLLWEQGLSNRTKENYKKNEQGEEEFTAFMQKHRHELVASLTRILTGLSGQEVAIERIGDGVTRCRLRSQYIGNLKFTKVDMVKEDGNLKLLLISD